MYNYVPQTMTSHSIGITVVLTVEVMEYGVYICLRACVHVLMYKPGNGAWENHIHLVESQHQN